VLSNQATDVGVVAPTSSLPDNAHVPTIENDLPVIVIALLLTLAITAPWWRCLIPDLPDRCSFLCLVSDYFCCGCFPCVIIPDEEEEEAVVEGVSNPVNVTLRFARSGTRSVPEDDESFWCSEDDAPSWPVGVPSSSARPSHPPAGEILPADGRVVDLEVSSL
jgi:hypothetical protein